MSQQSVRKGVSIRHAASGFRVLCLSAELETLKGEKHDHQFQRSAFSEPSEQGETHYLSAAGRDPHSRCAPALSEAHANLTRRPSL